MCEVGGLGQSSFFRLYLSNCPSTFSVLTNLSPLNCLCTYMIYWPRILWVYIWTLFYSKDLFVFPFANTTLSWLSSVLTLLVYGKSSDQVVWFLQLCSSFPSFLVILVPLHFHINFRINLPISTKMSCWDFYWN